jgi:two-component sensor histidine kinase
VLLHELTHRINNEFTAAISTVSLAAARSKNAEVKGALSRVADLLHQYAGVHHALQMPQYDTLVDSEAYLSQLCLLISRSKLDGRKIRLVLSAQYLRLQAKRCWLLGMIIYELVTNAAKHAFAQDSGEIRVSVWSDGTFIKCSVEDSGSAAANIRPGHGLKIVESLSRALEGCFEQTLGPRGSKSLLVFPHRGPAVVAEKKRKSLVQLTPPGELHDEAPRAVAC